MGVVLAAILFMHRMAQAVEIETHTTLIVEDVDDLATPEKTPYASQSNLPDGVEVYAINGPFFFGAAAHLSEVLKRIGHSPKVLILRMRNVPMIDATSVAAMLKFMEQCRTMGTHIILCRVPAQPRDILTAMCTDMAGCSVEFAANFAAARKRAETLLGDV